MQKLKTIKVVIISMFTCMIMIVTTFCVTFQYHEHQFPTVLQSSQYDTVPRSHYEYSIDQVTKRNAKYDYVSGWITVPGIKIIQYNTRLVLYHPGDQKMLTFKANLVKRRDVTAHIGDGLSHRASGFEIAVPSRYLKRSYYRIGFLVDVGKNPRLFKTGVPYQLTHGGK